MMKGKCLVCGIGNPMLKDDRAGIEVAERIAASSLAVDTEIIYGVGFEVTDKVLGYNDVTIIDACKMGHRPGTIVEASVEDIFTDHLLATSHAVTLGSTLKVGYEIFAEEMPPTLNILLIEAEDYFEFTRECSPPVKQAIDEVVARLIRYYSKMDHGINCADHIPLPTG
jgi:hydrogenase maturation protease